MAINETRRRDRVGGWGLFGTGVSGGGTGTPALDGVASMLLETGSDVDSFVLQEQNNFQIYLENS